MKNLAISNPENISLQATAYSQGCGIELVGGIANRQTYDALTGAYEPDYAVRACQMFPRCYLIDPDNPGSTDTFNARLDSFTWDEVTPGGVKAIYPTSTDGDVRSGYDVDTSGIYKGMLYVKSNVAVGVRRTMRFTGKWTDPVSGYVYVFRAEKKLVVEDATEAKAELKLDSAPSVSWNPMRQQAQKTIKALVMVGGKDVTSDARCRLWWYRIKDDGTRETISDTSPRDDWEIASVAMSGSDQITGITVDCAKMGEGIGYEAAAHYLRSGTMPPSPSDTDPKATTCIRRVIPQLEAKYIGSTTRIADGTVAIRCKAVVSDNLGVLPFAAWNEEARARWDLVTVTLDSSGNRVESLSLLGYGESVIVPADKGKFLRLTLEDRGNWRVLVDDGGKVLVDGDGKALVAREVMT